MNPTDKEREHARYKDQLPPAIIVDLDGTLSDMRGIRGPFEWDKVGRDRPHADIIELVQMYNSNNFKIIVCSGRDAVCKADTLEWLVDFEVPFDKLFMRPEGSTERDAKIKSTTQGGPTLQYPSPTRKRKLRDAKLKYHIYLDHIKPKYDVRLAIDDRQQVVDMWREYAGLRCLQVAPGNF